VGEESQKNMKDMFKLVERLHVVFEYQVSDTQTYYKCTLRDDNDQNVFIALSAVSYIDALEEAMFRMRRWQHMTRRTKDLWNK
jgi:hypothetical protein